MADFRTRTPAIDPQAFANVLQRKAQMEQEQINEEVKRKQDRMKNITDAVIAGQTIASNMMTLAEKRNKLSQDRKEQDAQDKISSLVSQPPAIPTEEPSLNPEVNRQRMEALAQERKREIAKNLAISSSSKDFNKSLIEKENPSVGKEFAPQQAVYSSKKTGKPELAVMKNGVLYYPNTDTPIPPEEFGGKGYKNQIVQNADGSMQLINVADGNTVADISSSPENPTKVEGKPLKIGINQLQKLEVDRLEKLKEDFNTDKAVSAALTKQGDYEVASAAIETGNWVGDAALISVAAKGLGRDVGNLSAEEQERYRSSPQVIQKIKSKISRWTTGIIPEEDRESFREALRIAREKNDYIIQKKREIYGRTAASRIKDLDPKFAESYIYDYTPLTEKKDTNAAIEDFFNNPTGE